MFSWIMIELKIAPKQWHPAFSSAQHQKWESFEWLPLTISLSLLFPRWLLGTNRVTKDTVNYTYALVLVLHLESYRLNTEPHVCETSTLPVNQIPGSLKLCNVNMIMIREYVLDPCYVRGIILRPAIFSLPHNAGWLFNFEDEKTEV